MRLDRHLQAHGLAESRAKAQALIEAGVVLVDGAPARKPAQSVPAGANVTITADPCPWVSRGGLKLAHALDHFGLTPSGTALDLGVSTGGFTEVLLARGAARVHGVDVGHGQLHARLAGDPRLVLHEGVNARAIPPGLVPRPDWITADLSFVSLTKVLPAVLPLAAAEAHLVALVKPQFELGPGAVGKGGIVSDPEARLRALNAVREAILGLGWGVIGQTESPIEGGDGNREWLIAARSG